VLAASGGLYRTGPRRVIKFHLLLETIGRRLVRLTVIERASREVRRGTRPVSSLTKPASCERIVFGVISEAFLERETPPGIFTKCVTLPLESAFDITKNKKKCLEFVQLF
jgi:hypothetical protein